MKKLLFFLILVSVLSIPLFGSFVNKKQPWFTAFSAGYVFKHDHEFKKVYVNGIVNMITADGCYYPWKHWGIGAKVSYWRAKGWTTLLKQRSVLQEIPATLYLRIVKKLQLPFDEFQFGFEDLQPGFQLYASLGGGLMVIDEKSYRCNVRLYKGIGEAEVGFNCPVWRSLNITGAVRYLFPPQSQAGRQRDVGGVDLRAGIGFAF